MSRSNDAKQSTVCPALGYSIFPPHIPKAAPIVAHASSALRHRACFHAEIRSHLLIIWSGAARCGMISRRTGFSANCSTVKNEPLRTHLSFHSFASCVAQ